MGRHLDSIAEQVKRLPPTMRLDTRVGEEVVFTGKGGNAMQNDFANKELEVGKVYQVESLLVGGHSSTVYLKGHSRAFNSVHFQNPDQWADRNAEARQ